MTMIEPRPSTSGRRRRLYTSGCRARRHAASPFTVQRLSKRGTNPQISDLRTNRNAENSQVAAIVTLDQDTNGVASRFRRQHTRRSADPTLEPIAAHSRAAADRPFLHASGLGVIKRLQGMDRFHVFTVRVVHQIKSLGDDWIGEHKISAVLQLPLNRCIADSADTVRAGQENWSLNESPTL